MIPTPIGYPVTVGIYIDFEAYAYWGLKVKGKSISLYAGGEVDCNIGAWGGFEVPKILTIGAYFEGSIFTGSVQIEMNASISNKFSADIEAKMYMNALVFKSGIFV